MKQCSVVNKVWPRLHTGGQPGFTILQPCRNHGSNPDISLASRVVLTVKILECSSSSLWMKRGAFYLAASGLRYSQQRWDLGSPRNRKLEQAASCMPEVTTRDGAGGKPSEQKLPMSEAQNGLQNLCLDLSTQSGRLGLSPSLPGSRWCKR